MKTRDHIRLLHAFGLPLTKLTTAAWTTGTLSLFALGAPGLLVPVAGVVAGLGGYSIADRRAIARGLREVDAFGFPITGYRAWILADTPTLDIELVRDVDVEVVASSTAAVDDSLIVEKRGTRVFRFVMRPIALPNSRPHLPPIQIGDRRLLHELHRRILAPLHADVGIVRMQMGDQATLVPLVPQPRGEDEPPALVGLGAFRESAMAAPPALQALVHDGGERAMPHEARRLRLRSERVMHAAHASPSGFGTVVGISFGGMLTGGQFGLTGVWVGLASGVVAGVSTVITGNRKNAKALARAITDQGYPIHDYEDWLLSGRPLMDIATERPIDRGWFHTQVCRLTAWSVTKDMMVSWVEDVVWMSDTEVRLETRPSYIQPPTSRIPPFYGGSHDMFRHFTSEVLPAVHARYTIRSVQMGGYIDRRI